MLTPKQNYLNRKHIIEQAFGTQTAFAEKAEISRVCLFKTIKCITKNKLMQEHICRLLGVTKETFFPEIYAVDSVPHDLTVINQTCEVN